MNKGIPLACSGIRPISGSMSVNQYSSAKLQGTRVAGAHLAKGKPAERQGRKVSGLRGKTYDSGAANT
jgi:hypothetical protein